MSNILISGCGITFQGKDPTWAKVFRLAGAKMKDVSGPAISNDLIELALKFIVSQNQNQKYNDLSDKSFLSGEIISKLKLLST